LFADLAATLRTEDPGVINGQLWQWVRRFDSSIRRSGRRSSVVCRRQEPEQISDAQYAYDALSVKIW
jgi:hypothetical protein